MSKRKPLDQQIERYVYEMLETCTHDSHEELIAFKKRIQKQKEKEKEKEKEEADCAQRKEVYDLFSRYYGVIPFKQYTTLFMRVVCKMSHEQISESSGKKLGAIRTTKYRAIKNVESQSLPSKADKKHMKKH
jgi:DNA-directed RNA polymerase specialized sigma24 family protein